MGRVLHQLVEIIRGNDAGHAVILVGGVLRHRQDLAGLGVHGDHHPTRDAKISVVVNIPIIDIPLQDGCRRLLQTGVDGQADIVARHRVDRGFQVAQYLPSHIHFHRAGAGSTHERVIQRILHPVVAHLVTVG